MPLLPVGALGGGRSVAPLGQRRMDGRLPSAACEQREQECCGDQTGRNIDKIPLGSTGTGSSSLASTATPSRGRGFLSSPTAGSTPSPKSPKHNTSSKVRFRSVVSVREFTPSNAPSSVPHSPDVDFDTQGEGADIPIDRSSPFFGGSGLRLALVGEQMLRSSQ